MMMETEAAPGMDQQELEQNNMQDEHGEEEMMVSCCFVV